MATGVKISAMAAVSRLGAGDLGTCVQGGVNKNFDVGSTQCKAWVNFDGTGTVAIRGNYNVSSITDKGTGSYGVNFTTAMADVNYSFAGNSGPNNSFVRWSNVAKTTSAIDIITVTDAGAASDESEISLQIFGA